MFWRMNGGLNGSSTLEATLDRALGSTSNGTPLTGHGPGGFHNVVDELLDEQDLLSELKAGNQRIVQVLSAKDNVRSLLAWSVYGTDEIERHADEAERKVLEDLVKQGGLDHWEDTTSSKGGASSMDQSAILPDTATLTDNSPSSLWGNFPSSSPQPDVEGDAKRQRFPHLATEILCADYFQISETLWSDLSGLLGPMWDIVLSSREEGLGMPAMDGYTTVDEKARLRSYVRYEIDKAKVERDDEDEKRREIIRGNWTRVNGMLMIKQPARMLQFIKEIPDVITRLIDRIDSPAIQDTILRIIACEEAGVTGTIEWLCKENLIPKMIALLSPHQPAATHATVAEVIKAVIALTSPNAFNPNGGNGTDPQVMTSPSGDTNANSNSESPTTNATGQFSNAGTSNSDNQPQQVSNPPPGQRDNRLVRELVMQDNIAILVSPMSQDPGHPDPLAAMRRAASPSSVMVDISLNGQDPQAEPETKASESEEPSYSFDPYTVSRRPSVASITSTFCQSITILIELIRKNNSDYSEPYLFHSIRNRLMGMQQRKVENRFHAKEESDRNTTETTSLEEDAQDRQEMEDAMAEMSGKLGIVHLGPLLASVSGRIEVLQNLISSPRHLGRARTPGVNHPLTAERLRIVELYAEMLHCSNMSILNRSAGTGPEYTDDGRLKGGLEALEDLGSALENGNDTGPEEQSEDIVNQVTPARDLPVSSCGSTDCSLTGSDDEKEPNEADTQKDHPQTHDTQGEEADEPLTPKQKVFDDMLNATEKLTLEREASCIAEARDSSEARRSNATTEAATLRSNEILPRSEDLSIGNMLKSKYIEHRVLPVIIDLFFDHPNNNFLHNVTYDIVQQILNGRVDSGLNRDLIIDLFREAKIAEKILHTQQVNERISGGQRSKRLALMGHMLLIADEIEKFLERCPMALYSEIQDTFVRSEWDAFVLGELRESRQRDAQPLGGGRPSPATLANAARQAEMEDLEEEDETNGAFAGQPLTRATSSGEAFSNSFGFGTPDTEEGRYRNLNRFITGDTYSGSFASSDEDSDDSSSESPRASRIDGREGRQRMLSDGFDSAFSPPSEADDLDDDWGDFASAGTGQDDDSDPFGDPFQPSHRPFQMSIHANRPMTAADFANQAFEEQFAGEANNEGITMPDNMIGDDSFESAADFLAANWSVPGGEFDTGEDMPPTRFSHNDDFGDSRSFSDTSSVSTISPGSSPEVNRTLHPAARIGRRPSRSSAISPPDPTLVRATDDDEPLGHGVSADTTVEQGGMLKREIGGRTVTVPQDDIALAATHARKHSQ